MTAVEACNRCASSVEHGDLRCAVCGLVVPEGADAPRDLQVEVLRCDGCGVAVSYDADSQAPACAFCGAVMHLETIEDPLEQAEAYLPFTVDAATARTALRSWMDTLGFFRPNDLRTTSRVEEMKQLWWVGWLCNGQALVSWAADSDAGAGRSAWAPHAGQVTVDYDNVVVSASRGLTLAETATLAPSYDLGTTRTEPEEGRHSIVEQFDVQRSAARRQIMEGLQAHGEACVAAGCIPGTTYRNLHSVSMMSSLQTHRVAFPAWVLAYRYRGGVYRAVISGQNEANIKASAPYSWAKILAVVLGGVGLLAAILVIIFASL